MSASTSTASPGKSSKKLSGGAIAGIAIAAAVVIGGIVGALVIILCRRRRDQKWERKAIQCESHDGESKKDLFSPDAGAGYESMWTKAPIVVETIDTVRPGTATTSSARVSPISHGRGDSNTLGMDAPSIVVTGTASLKSDTFGDQPVIKSVARNSAKPVPNFSTPTRRSGSITALPLYKD